MPREFGRNVRIAEAIHRAAAPVLAAAAREARLGMVTITGVDVASDLKHARIFVSVLGGPPLAEALTNLRGVLPRLRTLVAGELRLKRLPELHLESDESVARGVRISELLRASTGASKADPG